MYRANIMLHQLAMERAVRGLKENPTTVQNQEELWSCPVCYTDGAASGQVIPKCCTHKICLDCYSNILISTTNCTCPVCRAVYRPDISQVPAHIQEPIHVQEPIQVQEPIHVNTVYNNENGHIMLRASSISADIMEVLSKSRNHRRKHIVKPMPKSLIENITETVKAFFTV
jgi:hypothetical protein